MAIKKRPEKRTSKDTVKNTSDNSKMLNTRLQKDLIKRIKRCCVEEEMTIQDFISQAVQEKLKKMGY